MRRHVNQHNRTQQNDIPKNSKICSSECHIVPSVAIFTVFLSFHHYFECHYAEHRFTECCWSLNLSFASLSNSPSLHNDVLYRWGAKLRPSTSNQSITIHKIGALLFENRLKIIFGLSRSPFRQSSRGEVDVKNVKLWG